VPKVHGKHTVFKLDDKDLTQYCNNSQITVSAATTDTTTYGKDAVVKDGSLLDGKLTVSGFYDSTAMTGPRAVILPLVGTTVAFVHQPEGTGSGLPQDTGDCIVTSYVQTHPANDYITWSIDIECSDDIDHSAQAA
jgi:hypothetical protein